MKKILVLSILIDLLVAFGIGYFIFVKNNTSPVSIPDYYRFSIDHQTKSTNQEPEIRSETGDLDNDGVAEEYVLEQKRLTVSEDGQTIWQTSEDWQVDDFALADSNNDGAVDLNLSVWKSGEFGTSQPFWIEEGDPSIKNHFFIFDLVDDSIKPVWQSSNLAVPNCEFVISDIDGDEKNDLVVIEGEYSESQKCEGQFLAVWKWNQWGFFNEWRSEKGDFQNLKIEVVDNLTWVLADEF